MHFPKVRRSIGGNIISFCGCVAQQVHIYVDSYRVLHVIGICPIDGLPETRRKPHDLVLSVEEYENLYAMLAGGVGGTKVDD